MIHAHFPSGLSWFILHNLRKLSFLLIYDLNRGIFYSAAINTTVQFNKYATYQIGELIGMISQIAHSRLTVWVANSWKAHNKLIMWIHGELTKCNLNELSVSLNVSYQPGKVWVYSILTESSPELSHSGINLRTDS